MSGLKILIVDDQPAVLAALEVLFDVHGFETLAARTPQQALELVRSEELGVVLQDMNFHRDATSGEEGEALLQPQIRIASVAEQCVRETAGVGRFYEGRLVY